MNQLPDKHKDPLKKLISNKMLEQPSDQFTASVMGKLGIAPSPVIIKYEPVISRKGWFLIASISFMLIYLALSGSTTESFDTKAVLVQSAIEQSAALIDNVFSGSVALLLAIGTLAAFLLLSAESIYRRTQLHTV